MQRLRKFTYNLHVNCITKYINNYLIDNNNYQ